MHQLLVFLAACAGGGFNSVAGGGTLLTVPTLIWLGAPALNANATSTVALWPGNLLAVAITGIAIAYLVFTDLILWETALLMAVSMFLRL